MPDKKLTDNEIKKALECCANNPNDCVCYESKCPLFGQKCIDILSKNALDLINRQKAEVERLKSDVSVSKDAYMSMKDRYEYEKEKVEKAKQKCIDIGKALKNAKIEAYKEFAERLKENSIATFSWNGVVLVEEIDNLLKEMVGDN